MRAGKSTAASYLQDNYNFVQASIAGKLKELYFALHKSPKKDREWLQKTGAAMRKVFGEDFWVEVMLRELEDQGTFNFVVDDVRYQNELLALTDFSDDLCDLQPFNKFIVIHVDCPIDIQIARGAEISLMNHRSEDLAKKIHNQVAGNYTYPSYIKLGGEKMVVYAIDGSHEPSYLYSQIEEVLERTFNVGG
jgi:dephospho-CoA kinase